MTIDPSALVAACDVYAEQMSDADELAMGAAIDRYLEAVADHRSMEEVKDAARLRDTDPGRWPEWASPARMRRDITRDREEDRMLGTG